LLLPDSAHRHGKHDMDINDISQGMSLKGYKSDGHDCLFPHTRCSNFINLGVH
jgi:hypothetical protein